MLNQFLANVFAIILLASIITLIIGMVRPSIFAKFSKNTPRRKPIFLWIFGLIIISFFGIGFFAAPIETENNKNAVSESLSDPVDDKINKQNARTEQDGKPALTENSNFQPEQKIEPEEPSKKNEIPKTLINQEISIDSTEEGANLEVESKLLYPVTNVIDGDTFKVNIDGKIETVRLIGINTPETVDPRKPVECFGVEASNKAKSLLSGKKVLLESDISQGERDIYGRLLRYAFLEDGTNFNLLMIEEGFAFEYTYIIPYKYQTEFKAAQKTAMNAKAGLWADDACQTDTAAQHQLTNDPNACVIKGNINLQGEKIYHMIGCASYDKTVIDESAGEKWFCTEQEALDAGWRKALNCP